MNPVSVSTIITALVFAGQSHAEHCAAGIVDVLLIDDDVIVVGFAVGVCCVAIVAVALLAQSTLVPDWSPLVETYLHPFTVLTEI